MNNTTNTLSVVKSLKDLSDRDLVLGLKSIEEESSVSRYQTEFYRRFAPYIFKVASQNCQVYPGGDALARDLTQETFIRAFAAIDNFTIIVGEDAVFKKLIKAWLGKIANRHFLKLYALRKNEDAETECTEAQEPSYDVFDTLFEPPPEEQPSMYVKLLREAMARLKEIDQHIVNSYAAEGCLESTRHISDSTMHLLCETYKTTSENIRKRKNRALQKIREHCFKN
ncbi:RNA polymerase sigma factor [Mucilaginibacter sp. OK098]|uniref:RNA polymerase sigma factor n=1 Tax=Mucilaginibacter sp. OK098 TaxID=1855297 RepID=UPI000918D303|nr:sigma-70 family RNA polymerase sigma factor [Mucilaginibacter sp. OK098]SHN32861.1 RNA polymerase sigma factor, sigma-70 family [Mucilaginibacter sp. OK098]